MNLTAKRSVASLVLIPFVILWDIAPVSAITAELAKKCQAMAYKAHPVTPVGVKNGTAQAQRVFFNACVANNGTAPADDSQKLPTGSAK
jgi:hypothetical protein